MVSLDRTWNKRPYIIYNGVEMKYTIEGFSQEFALTLKKEVVQNGKTTTRKIDCTDLVILRWFVDFYPNMKKVEVDGRQYAFLSHKKLLEDLPLIDITKKSFIERMKKLVDFNVLSYRFIKEGGSISLYGFGENYANLVSRIGNQTDTGCYIEQIGGNRLNGYEVGNQTDTINNSIINTSTNNKINIAEQVLSYLNEKAGTHFKPVESNLKFIRARLKDYNESDLKAVVDKKTAEWKGTQMQMYLRPETLFNATKFESYINGLGKARQKHFANEREYTQAQYDAIVTDVDDIDI